MTDPSIPSAGRSALLIGATGLVGGHCLELLLDHDAYDRVETIGRRPADRKHDKLIQHVIDFDRLEEASSLFQVDDVFCCLGTTIHAAGSQEAFERVDVDYPIAAARIASEEGAEQFLVVSALGADPDSRIFYNRAKGAMEAAVRGLPLRSVWVLRPALLLGDREETRIGERIGALVMRPFGWMLRGSFRRYRPIAARDVARAMVRLAIGDGIGGVVESDEIQELATS